MKILWKRPWQPTLIFLPGESQKQRRLAGYNQKGCKVLDTAEVTWHAHKHRPIMAPFLGAQRSRIHLQCRRHEFTGSGRSLRKGNDNPSQYSCLGNPMNRGAWRATVHGAAKIRTRLVAEQQLPQQKQVVIKKWNLAFFNTHTHTHTYIIKLCKS